MDLYYSPLEFRYVVPSHLVLEQEYLTVSSNGIAWQVELAANTGYRIQDLGFGIAGALKLAPVADLKPTATLNPVSYILYPIQNLYITSNCMRLRTLLNG